MELNTPLGRAVSWLDRGKNGESERRTEVGGLWDEQGNPRRERTGRCLNIEHMSVSPLKPTRPTKIEATTVDHRTTILLSKTDREREILSDSACFAAPCLLLRGLLFSRVSVVRLLVPASPSPPSSFYISISPFVLLGRV